MVAKTDIPAKTDIKDLTKDQLISRLQAHNEKPYRADQILKWIYSYQVDDFNLMTDISKKTRAYLPGFFTISRLNQIDRVVSADGTIKYLFRLDDGNDIESVLIPEKNYYTLCVSSQVGCAQGCRFCLTGKDGFIRNLKKGEIIAQVRDVAADLESAKPLTNIVFMGMGEPLANFDNVAAAVDTITDPVTGLGFAARRVTLSTAGLANRLKDFNHRTKINLAVSLNASDNKTRSRLMPINTVYPIETLIDRCRELNLKPRQRITFEYILIKGINDGKDHAHRLVDILKTIPAKINLIPFNPYEGSFFQQPDDQVVADFHQIILKRHLTVIVRKSKGRDIHAACGQLRANRRAIEEKPKSDLSTYRRPLSLKKNKTKNQPRTNRRP